MISRFHRWLIAVALIGSLVAISSPASAIASPWTTAKSSRALGGTHFVTSTTGASLVFAVKGKTFTMWYTATNTSGKAAIFVNGKRVRTIDQYSSRTVRRAVTFTKMRSTNTVRVVALATRNSKSKGKRIIVDAFSLSSKSCSKGCVRNPLPVSTNNVVAEAGLEPVWYPSAVPSRSDPLWTVAIGSYVRGQDVLPIDTAVPVIRAAACDQAKRVPRGVVILSFGIQTATGTSGFGRPISNAQIIATTSAWATGLAECATGPWEVSIGTSNSGGVTRFNGYLGGRSWARLVEQARAASDPRTVVSGSVDLEPGWGPPGQARAWVDGYVDATTTRLWNFGSADGCPQTISTDLTCNNGWTIDDVLWVSSHGGANVLAMPQIHTKSGSQARQWARLAARAVEMGMPLRLAAITVQTAACSQVRSGCPTTGISAWDGWGQLRQYLDAQPTTRGYKVGAPMDIRWGWANGFVIPPETTTTTTTTTTVAPTTTTTTAAPPPKLSQAALAVASTSATYGQPLSLVTIGGSGSGAVTWQKVSGQCSIVNNTLSPSDAGSLCEVRATKAGDNSYLPVDSPNTIITIGKGTQTSFAISSTATFVAGTSHTLTSSGGLGTGTVSWVLTAGACSLNGSTLTSANGGITCSVTASHAGDVNYFAATATQTITVVSP